MAIAAPALVAAWSLSGFYGSLGPALVHLITGSRLLVVHGGGVAATAEPFSVAAMLLAAAFVGIALRHSVRPAAAATTCPRARPVAPA